MEAIANPWGGAYKVIMTEIREQHAQRFFPKKKSEGKTVQPNASSIPEEELRKL